MEKTKFKIKRFFIYLIPFRKLRKKLIYEARKTLFYSTYKFSDLDSYLKKYPQQGEVIKYGKKNFTFYRMKNFYVPTFKDYSLYYNGTDTLFDESFDSPYIKDAYELHFFEQNSFANKIKVKQLSNVAIRHYYNYWHFIFEALPKVHILETNGYTGKYLIFDKPFTRELMNLLGVDNSRLLIHEPNVLYEVEDLFISQQLYGVNNDFSYIYKELRDKILSSINMSDISSYPKKIYVKRIGLRKIKNEDQFLPRLTNLGYEVMIPEEHSISEQIKYFHAADIVITGHGANCTNAIFMRENTHFMECFGNNFISGCMQLIINPLKLYYHQIVETNYLANHIADDYDANVSLINITVNTVEGIE